MKTLKSHKKVITVWLEPEIIEGENREKIFFCFSCRIPLVQYTGRVTSIIPGDHPYEPATILKCKGNVKQEVKDNNGMVIKSEWRECGNYYSFVSSVFTKNPRVE